MTSPQPTTDRKDRVLPWIVGGGLLLLIAVVYGQTLRFGFLGYDDPAYVFDNPVVSAGLTRGGINWALTSGPFGEWYPLAMMSHMVDCNLFGIGPPGNGHLGAGGHHLTNVLLHAAATILLFLVLWRMTGQRAVPGTDQRLVVAGYLPTTPRGREVASGVRVAPAGPSAITTLWPSAFVAAVFAVHPQHVESVVWIAERRDVLSGLFFVLTLAAYLGYVRHGKNVDRYLLVAAMLTLGLMAKPILVTVPALLLVLDYWPLGRFGQAGDVPSGVPVPVKQSFGSLVVEKLPLLAIALSVVAITLHTHPTDSGGPTTPLAVRIAAALVSLITYQIQFFYPAHLAIFYPLPAEGYPLWQTAGAFAILSAMTLLAFRWRRACPAVWVGWLWFVGTLVPVLGLVQVSHHAMADRYMYLPAIGYALALAWGACRLATSWSLPRWVLPVGSAAAIALWTAAAVRQTSLWQDDLTLWTHALATTEDNAEAEVGLADALRRADRLDEALVHYRLAAAMEANGPILNNMALTLLGLGRTEEAAEEYRRAVKFVPKSAKMHDSLGFTLYRLDDLDGAADECFEAIKLDRAYALAWYHLGLILVKQNQAEQSIPNFEQAIQLDPRLAPAHRDLATVLASLGQTSQAVAHYRAALQIKPDDADARAALERLGGN